MDRLGLEDTRAALLQLGFLHGLRDALTLGAAGEPGAAPFASARLPMQLARRPHDGSRIEIRGLWPEAREARARAAAGPDAGATCCASTGYTSGWLSGLFGADVLAVETSCVLRGDPCCSFEAREPDAWIALGDARAEPLLADLPFRALRAASASDPPAGVEPTGAAFQPDSPAVHVWGPVMVVPFSGADETLKAIELIGQDPGAAEVSVVVLDLTGTLVDDGFGAVALERAIEAVASWGAETILTGVSPLSEAAVAGIEQPHLVVRKDLQEAIAAAFQVAAAIRRPA